MTEYLIQKKTNRVLVRTKTLERRKDMMPARYDRETDCFVPDFEEVAIQRPVPVKRQSASDQVMTAELRKPSDITPPVVEAPGGTEPETAEATTEASLPGLGIGEEVPADPLSKLKRKEISDLCLERYGRKISYPKMKTDEVVAEFRRIEAEYMNKNDRQSTG